MDNCQNCGALLEADDQFCSNCGAAVPTGGDGTPETGDAGAKTAGATGQTTRGGQRTARQAGAGTRQQGTGTRKQQAGPAGPGGNWAGGGYPRPPDRHDTDVIGERIGAQIVDSVVMLALFLIPFAFAAVAASPFRGFTSGDGIAAFLVLVGFVLPLLYWLLIEGYWTGYTVGKRMFGIKVVTETGEPVGYSESIVRNLLEIIDGFFYYVVGFIAIASTDKRQRIGDLVGNTVVVREEPREHQQGARGTAQQGPPAQGPRQRP